MAKTEKSDGTQANTDASNPQWCVQLYFWLFHERGSKANSRIVVVEDRRINVNDWTEWLVNRGEDGVF